MSDTVLTDAKTMCFIASANPDVAKKFYSETLGLEFLVDDEYGMMFSVHKTLLLRIQKFRDLKPQPFTVFGWQVDDISEAVRNLTTRGVKFEKFGFPSQDDHGICTFENGDKVAWFKDPDGNTLSIAQIAGR